MYINIVHKNIKGIYLVIIYQCRTWLVVIGAPFSIKSNIWMWSKFVNPNNLCTKKVIAERIDKSIQIYKNPILWSLSCKLYKLSTAS